MKCLASMLMLVCYLPFAGMQDVDQKRDKRWETAGKSVFQLRTVGPGASVLPGPMPINAEPRVKVATLPVSCHMYG